MHKAARRTAELIGSSDLRAIAQPASQRARPHATALAVSSAAHLSRQKEGPWGGAESLKPRALADGGAMSNLSELPHQVCLTQPYQHIQPLRSARVPQSLVSQPSTLPYRALSHVPCNHRQIESYQATAYRTLPRTPQPLPGTRLTPESIALNGLLSANRARVTAGSLLRG